MRIVSLPGLLDKEANMFVSKTITIQRTMPLIERISEVSKQISEWLETLEKPFNLEKDMLRLTKYERKGGKYLYHYTVRRAVSASDVNNSI